MGEFKELSMQLFVPEEEYVAGDYSSMFEGNVWSDITIHELECIRGMFDQEFIHIYMYNYWYFPECYNLEGELVQYAE